MSDLPTLLPPNARSVERNLEQAMTRLQGLSLHVSALWNPDLCPENLLPYLAWAMSIEIWDEAWTVEQKRATIKSSVAVHRLKGTKGSVVRALRALGVKFDLSEWFETGDAVHTFRLDAYAAHSIGGGVDAFDALFAQIDRSVEAVKPVRSHSTIRLGLASGSQVGLGQATCVGLRLSGHAQSRRSPLGLSAPINLATASVAAIRMSGTAVAVRSGLEG